MSGDQLRKARLVSSLTQHEAARKLGVTQAYLSMVERGTRPVSSELASMVIKVFEVSPTALPLGKYEQHTRDELFFKQALGVLGYPGFAYLLGTGKRNPTELLMEALDSENLDPRVTEALPWLPVTYPEMDWDWLTLNAKIRDRQNRLAFVVALASQIASRRGDADLAEMLSQKVAMLERSRLAAEDTLGRDSVTQSERMWLRTHRSPEAQHWNLLTDLSAEHLDHAFR
jgi:transcriptional regulator with XRE-family HTH domain